MRHGQHRTEEQLAYNPTHKYRSCDSAAPQTEKQLTANKT